MNAKEFAGLVEIAAVGSSIDWKNDPSADERFNNHLTSFINLPPEDLSPRNRKLLTKDAAITVIRYQALYLNGDWDIGELNTLQKLFRYIDIINV